jgi:hypothetical protein
VRISEPTGAINARASSSWTSESCWLGALVRATVILRVTRRCLPDAYQGHYAWAELHWPTVKVTQPTALLRQAQLHPWSLYWTAPHAGNKVGENADRCVTPGSSFPRLTPASVIHHHPRALLPPGVSTCLFASLEPHSRASIGPVGAIVSDAGQAGSQENWGRQTHWDGWQLPPNFRQLLPVNSMLPDPLISLDWCSPGLHSKYWKWCDVTPKLQDEESNQGSSSSSGQILYGGPHTLWPKKWSPQILGLQVCNDYALPSPHSSLIPPLLLMDCTFIPVFL